LGWRFGPARTKSIGSRKPQVCLTFETRLGTLGRKSQARAVNHCPKVRFRFDHAGVAASVKLHYHNVQNTLNDPADRGVFPFC
jgi:hypothetical protein